MTGRKREFTRYGRPIPQYKVTLTCGCRVPSHDTPRSGTKFACPGAGHGYQLAWTVAVDATGCIRHNIPGETR